MKRSRKGKLSALARFTSLAIVIAMLTIALTPSAGARETTRRSPGERKGATFDLFSLFSEQALAPVSGLRNTFMPLEARNIVDVPGVVELTAHSESGCFKVRTSRSRLAPRGANGTDTIRVEVSCAANTPEGTVGWIKMTGKRGAESHRLWLKVTALSSQPELKIPSGLNLADIGGQGYADPPLKLYVGKPLSWNMVATNSGGGSDVYDLSYSADFQCRVKFSDAKGRTVTKLELPGVTRNMLYARPAKLTVGVTPLGGLAVKKPGTVKIALGPGKNSKVKSEVPIQVMDPGLLYCASDLATAAAAAHQVMPGESTTFLFHLTNSGKTAENVALGVAGGAPGWKVGMDRMGVAGLCPGHTADVTMRVDSPATAQKGDRLQLSVTASGRTVERSDVAVDVTDVRNVYYFSIDSMNPEYLGLNRKGTGPGKDGDWLMPNLKAFMKDSTDYTNARTYLPSATDMNHTNALSGTYSGTSGIYMVGGTFQGFTDHDEILTGANTMDLMKYGPDGKPVERLFEVAKKETAGKSVCGFWSNKNWLTNLEAEKTLDLYGHSEHWPLFFQPPYKYNNAGDPQSDQDPSDPVSASFKACFCSNNFRSVLLPTILGQFQLVAGLRLITMPVTMIFGMTPGMHAEDRYIYDSFERSVIERDPDVAYVNLGDLDNTGHFTGASWDPSEFAGQKNGESKYTQFARRDDALDICREADLLFGKYIALLKSRGVYDNSVIVMLSDHGMENLKTPERGYEALDLREILRSKGYVYREDYFEAGGAELNFIWSSDEKKTADIERILEGYTVHDKELGDVHPLMVVDRREQKEGVDYGKFGRVRPGELYSQYWIDHPGQGNDWPDLFIFPLYNYQVLAHGDLFGKGLNNVGLSVGARLSESVAIGFPACHGGLGTSRIPLIFKAPVGNADYRPGSQYSSEVEIGQIAPAIYRIMGWPQPDCVNTTALPVTR
jgi:hypothetical protein